MVKFIEWLKHPLVEAVFVIFELYLAYRFGRAAYGFFTAESVESTTSLVGQFFGTRVSLVILGVAYGILAVLFPVSLADLAWRGSRRLNEIALICAYALVGYTFWIIILFAPETWTRLGLVIIYSTGIIIGWLRSKLITRRKPRGRRPV